MYCATFNTQCRAVPANSRLAWWYAALRSYRLGSIPSAVIFMDARSTWLERSPGYVLRMLLIYLFFYGRLMLRSRLTEVRETFTHGGP